MLPLVIPMLLDIVYALNQQGVTLRATEQTVDTRSAAGKASLNMLGVFAQFETNLRRERQMEGIAAAKARGHVPRNKPSIDSAEVWYLYTTKDMGATAIARLLGIVARLKQHIPEKFFRMVRYFDFLANRVCGEKLPQVYRALGMDKPEPVAKVCYAQMGKQFLRRDPFECVLCGGKMVYRRAVAGLSVQGLKTHAREISLMR